MNRAELLNATGRMIDAAAPVVGRVKAQELARNVASVLIDGEEDPQQVCTQAILHRINAGRLSVGSVADLAEAMTIAWRAA